MTTIGYATLAIIPSLRGVTDAIDSQIDGKVVSISIEPKVDQRAAEKAGKQARETIEKQTTEIKVEPKVDRAAAEKAGQATGEAVTKGAKEAVRKGDIGGTVGDEIKGSVEKASPGKDIAKVLVDGIADGVKGEIRGGPLVDALVDGLAGGVKQGIDGGNVGGQAIKTIGDAIRSGNLPGTIKDAVLPGIRQIGTEIRIGAADWAGGIGAALRSGDIQGATDDIGNTVRNTTDLISGIGSAFGLQTDGVRTFGNDVGEILTGAAGMTSNIETVKSTLTTLKGTGLEVGGALDGALSLAGPLAAAVTLDNAYKGILGKINEITGTSWATDINDRLGPGAGKWYLDEFTGKHRDEAREKARAESQRKADEALAAARLAGPPPKPSAPKPVPKDITDLLGLGPGHSAGGFTGNFPIDKIAGVVHGGEHVIKASSQRSIENAYPGLLDYLNNTGRLPGYSGGGRVDEAKQFAKSIDPAKYLMGGFSTSAIDCSGLVSAVVNVATGRPPFSSRMSTVTEGSWLQSLGFKSGPGSSGDLRVGWWDKGGGANGHTAGTLPDGTNFESNGSEGVVVGGKTGANAAQFTQHAYLPAELFGGGTTEALSGLGLGAGQADASETTNPVAASGSGGDGASMPSSISGLSSFGLDALGSGVGKTSSGSDLSKFGGAASAAVSGQVSSALGVLGVGDSPGWLQGISTLVGSIGVTDKSSGKAIFGGGAKGYGGAAPVAASAPMVGTQAPAVGNVHGGGGQPGPAGPTYNIRTALTEDAFIQAQRQERERAAAKLSRY